MDSDPNTTTVSHDPSVAIRSLEIEALTSMFPTSGIGARSRRVFNVWGECSVGKTTFIQQVIDSEITEKTKVLWVSPTFTGTIDTIEEFIAACAKGVRFPNQPDKQEQIASRIESVQRGKVDPMKSDDALLVVRSDLAKNKKPHINQAAAASVGRTEFEHDDVDISIGFAEDKAGNQCEGFLDALPLQSMGADLVVLNLSRMSDYSISVKDWLRDHIIPQASKGPYRRNLVFLVESDEPYALHHHSDCWQDWDDLRADFRLYPMSEDSVYETALRAGLESQRARLVYFKSLGYPLSVFMNIELLKNKPQDTAALKFASKVAAALPDNDQAKLAAACLPDHIHGEDFEYLFGKGHGGQILQWLSSLPQAPLSTNQADNSYSLSDDFRASIISIASDQDNFKTYRKRWLPYGRLIRNAPQKSDRAKLLLLAGLRWIDTDLSEDLFGERAEKVVHFLESDSEHVAEKNQHYHISERIRTDLRNVAMEMGHVGVSTILDRASELWSIKRNKIQNTIDDLERAIKSTTEEVGRLNRQHNELDRFARPRRSANQPVYDDRTVAAAKRNGHGGLIVLLFALSSTFFSTGFIFEYPTSLVSLIGGLITTCIGLSLLPQWNESRKAKELMLRAETKNTPEYFRKKNLEVTHTLQSNESALEDLEIQLERAQKDLEYAYV